MSHPQIHSGQSGGWGRGYINPPFADALSISRVVLLRCQHNISQNRSQAWDYYESWMSSSLIHLWIMKSTSYNWSYPSVVVDTIA